MTSLIDVSYQFGFIQGMLSPRKQDLRVQRAEGFGLTISLPRQTETTPRCPILAQYCSEEQAHMLHGLNGTKGETEKNKRWIWLAPGPYKSAISQSLNK